MTDLELAQFMGVRESDLALLSAERRATYEAMAEKYNEICLYEAGLGPKPAGVILCGPKQVRLAGKGQ